MNKIISDYSLKTKLNMEKPGAVWTIGPAGILHVLKFSSGSMEENVNVLKMLVSNL